MQETQETQVQSLTQEVPVQEGTATHSSILAWGIPWTEEPGGLQSIGLHRVGHFHIHQVLALKITGDFQASTQW